MKVKALDHVEDVNQEAHPDGNGGFDIKQRVDVLEAGKVYDLPDDQVGRLEKLGHVSRDLDAPLKKHLMTLRGADTGRGDVQVLTSEDVGTLIIKE